MNPLGKSLVLFLLWAAAELHRAVVSPSASRCCACTSAPAAGWQRWRTSSAMWSFWFSFPSLLLVQVGIKWRNYLAWNHKNSNIFLLTSFSNQLNKHAQDLLHMLSCAASWVRVCSMADAVDCRADSVRGGIHAACRGSFLRCSKGRQVSGSKCCGMPKDSMGNQNEILLLISLGLGPCPTWVLLWCTEYMTEFNVGIKCSVRVAV